LKLETVTYVGTGSACNAVKPLHINTDHRNLQVSFQNKCHFALINMMVNVQWINEGNGRMSTTKKEGRTTED
jgi:hypothetical protein